MPMPQGQLLASEEVQNNVSTRFEQACEELKLKGERQRADKAAKEQQEQREAAQDELKRPQRERLEAMKNLDSTYGTDVYANEQREQEDRDALLDDDDELDKLRQARVEQMKRQKNEYLENLSKGHGEYAEIVEMDFLKAVLASKFCVVHFYHKDFERCKIMDMHLARVAKKHVETRFFKMDAEKTPFFVEKLTVRTLPTLVVFDDGKATDRVLGFDGLPNGDEFTTRDLEERLGITGAIKMERGFYEDQADEAKQAAKRKEATGGIFGGPKTDDCSDPFDD